MGESWVLEKSGIANSDVTQLPVELLNYGAHQMQFGDRAGTVAGKTVQYSEPQQTVYDTGLIQATVK